MRALWFEKSDGRAPAPALSGSVDCDVAVVGAGIAGLSTALHLAQAGVSCVVVEADAAGAGASGRNTGFVVPALNASLGPAEIRRHVGAARGALLCDLVRQSADFLFDLVERHAIACDADRRGFLQAAPWHRQLAGLERRCADWIAAGADVEFLDRAAVAARTGSGLYQGAIAFRSGGTIDPLAYVLSLADRFRAAGGRLFEASPVSSVETTRAGWRLAGRGGEIRAAKLVLATNALVGALLPDLARSLIAIEVHQIATQALSPDDRRRVLPQGGCVTDMHRDPIAFRLTADGRLVGGGMAAWAPGAARRMPPFFAERFARLFPAIGKIESAYVWAGKVAVTRGFLPKFYSLGPGAYALVACNGRGNALATALGAALATALCRDDFAEFPLAAEALQPIPAHFFATLAPRVWLPWARLRDRIERFG